MQALPVPAFSIRLPDKLFCFITLFMQSHLPQDPHDLPWIVAGNQSNAAAAGQLCHLPVFEPGSGPGIYTLRFQSAEIFPGEILADTGAI